MQKKYQTMTDTLIQLILCVSIFLSNSCASLILSFIGVKVSADTIKNIYDRIKIMDNYEVEEIGIDDVATRKGMKYATAIYDLKNHHMIALLEGRDAESIKEWLKEHPKIKTITRDRASSYANAISEILPNCMQIADRFHLFENIIEYLKDIFYSEMPEKIFIQNEKILDEPPKKKSKYNPLSDKDKELNKLISNIRISVEHINFQVKIFRILAERYRSRIETFFLRAIIICCFYNLCI